MLHPHHSLAILTKGSHHGGVFTMVIADIGDWHGPGGSGDIGDGGDGWLVDAGEDVDHVGHVGCGDFAFAVHVGAGLNLFRVVEARQHIHDARDVAA